jgi:hypothetical protein
LAIFSTFWYIVSRTIWQLWGDPIGRIFVNWATLGRFLKITQVAQIFNYFSYCLSDKINFDKNGLGYIKKELMYAAVITLLFEIINFHFFPPKSGRNCQK